MKKFLREMKDELEIRKKINKFIAEEAKALIKFKLGKKKKGETLEKITTELDKKQVAEMTKLVNEQEKRMKKLVNEQEKRKINKVKSPKKKNEKRRPSKSKRIQGKGKNTKRRKTKR